MSDPQARQAIINAEHLRLLGIFYYIRAGSTALTASFPLIHVAMGIFMLVAMRTSRSSEPEFMGWMFIILGLSVFALGWLFALCQFLAGRFIMRRQHRIFCLVIGGINLLGLPYGTVAGIFTFIVLNRPAVKAEFDTHPAQGV